MQYDLRAKRAARSGCCHPWGLPPPSRPSLPPPACGRAPGLLIHSSPRRGGKWGRRRESLCWNEGLSCPPLSSAVVPQVPRGSCFARFASPLSKTHSWREPRLLPQGPCQHYAPLDDPAPCQQRQQGSDNPEQEKRAVLSFLRLNSKGE